MAMAKGINGWEIGLGLGDILPQKLSQVKDKKLPLTLIGMLRLRNEIRKLRI